MKYRIWQIGLIVIFLAGPLSAQVAPAKTLLINRRIIDEDLICVNGIHYVAVTALAKSLGGSVVRSDDRLELSIQADLLLPEPDRGPRVAIAEGPPKTSKQTFRQAEEKTLEPLAGVLIRIEGIVQNITRGNVNRQFMELRVYDGKGALIKRETATVDTDQRRPMSATTLSEQFRRFMIKQLP